MTHDAIYKLYKKKFHIDDETVDTWFPTGPDAIRVRFKNQTELIFIYQGPKKWGLTSVENFIEKMRGYNVKS